MQWTPRIAITTFFLIHGAVSGNWIARLPDVKNALGLSEGTLGLVLLGLPIGVITGMPIVSGFISRYGSHRMTLWTAILYCVTVPILAFAPNAILLFAALILFGITASLNDVSINSQGVGVEKQANRSIMSSLHAAFSIGLVLGTLMGEIFTEFDVSRQVHLLIASGLLLLLSLYTSRFLIEVEGETRKDAAIFTLPSRALLPLGVVAFICSIGEGAMADWSGVYMSEVLAVSGQIDGLGFVAFSLMMTTGRIAGDFLFDRFSTQNLVTASGLFASTGLIIVVLSPSIIPALLGFALIGIGLSYIIPLMFGIAGKMPDLQAGSGIAGVATLGYSGFLAGPPIIGLLADVFSLQVSFIVLALLVSTLVILSRSVRSHSGAFVRQSSVA